MSKQTRFASGDEVIGCIPLQLDENHAKEIMALAEGVENFEDIDNFGTNISRFTLVVELYHYEPSLLDSILVKLLNSLVANIHFPDKSDIGFSHKSLLALILLKRLTTVRGYKTIIQFLPHEVFMLPKLLSILEYYVTKEKCNNLENEAINMLLVWFIIVCRNPFDFHSFAIVLMI
uniref:Uncharacterized protein n=1 Tax=Panagrolaimus superbus TaxID=310955 RepID=A0A914XZQ3_9BILA